MTIDITTIKRDLTAKETAEYLGIAHRTLANWRVKKLGPAGWYRYGDAGAQVFYPRRSVITFKAQRDKLKKSMRAATQKLLKGAGVVA